MEQRRREDVEIDMCPKCGGVWLDGDEIAKVRAMDRARTDAEMRANWRLYDRGRDGYDPTPHEESEKSAIESLFGS
jgi:Zn-finger nucleic acid-binding protein